MPTLHYTYGLPGSGKTTWASEYVRTHPGTVLVDRDSLRDMMHNGRFSKRNEKTVTEAQHAILAGALNEGHDAIAGDTNLNPRTITKLEGIARDHGAELVKVDFTDVPLTECIRRDLTRSRSVGEDVIRGMWERYLAPPPRDRNPDLPAAILVDMDGTLAHMTSGRSPYHWDRVGEDTPDVMVTELARRFHPDHTIIVLTGRDGSCRDATEDWLIDHGIPFDELWSRAAGDQRKDSIVKRELFDAHVNGRFDPVLVVDDRMQVCDMWRSELGLTVWQVAPGRF